MNSILGITKSLAWDKFKLMNIILLGNLICLMAINIGGIANLFNDRFPQGLMNLTYGLVFIIGLLGLILIGERALASNRYRLVPVSNWGLYIVNILTTIVNFLYLLVIETSILALGYFFYNDYFNKKIFGQEIYHIQQNYPLSDISRVALLLALGVILIWTISTLLRLIVEWSSNFIPFKNNYLLKGIVIIGVLLMGALILFQTLINISQISLYNISNVKSNLFIVTCLIDIFAIIAGTLINVYMLGNVSETNK